MSLYISDSIKIHLFDCLQYQYKINYLFDLTSSAIIFSNNHQSVAEACIDSIGSEHWLWEASDYYRFNKENQLLYLANFISQRNKQLNNEVILHKEFLYLELIENKPFIVAPMEFRFFCRKNKRLFGFNRQVFSGEQIDAYLVSENFYMMFINKIYCGYLLVNPLNYVKSLNQILCGDAEYKIFNLLLFFISDNYYDKTEDDEVQILLKLKKYTSKSICSTGGKFKEFICAELHNYEDNI